MDKSKSIKPNNAGMCFRNDPLLVNKFEIRRDLLRLLKKAKSRIYDNIPKANNMELIIIKGHQILEAAMDDFISYSSDFIYAPENTRFSFHQKFELVFMFGLNIDFGMDLFLPRFNKLRNQIAHRLKFNQNLLDELITLHYDTFLDELPNNMTEADILRDMIFRRCFEMMDQLKWTYNFQFSEKYFETPY